MEPIGTRLALQWLYLRSRTLLLHRSGPGPGQFVGKVFGPVGLSLPLKRACLGADSVSQGAPVGD